jgi:TPR repeat protein
VTGKPFALPLVGFILIASAWAVAPVRHFFLGQAENSIGVLYSKGVGVKRDGAAALRWYEAAAENGSAAGQFNLAYALQLGSGTPIDRRAAIQWYERAAAQGVAEAANNLGMLYANPASGRPDLVLARTWLKRAISAADPELRATISANLNAMERDMSREELAASDALPRL